MFHILRNGDCCLCQNDSDIHTEHWLSPDLVLLCCLQTQHVSCITRGQFTQLCRSAICDCMPEPLSDVMACLVLQVFVTCAGV